MAVKISVKMTNSGRERINKMVAGIAKGLEVGISEGIERVVKPEVKNRAPTVQEEGVEISQGEYMGKTLTITSRVTAEQYFLKTGVFKPIRDAIQDEVTEITSIPGKVTGRWGKKDILSMKAGFAWQVADGSIRSTTDEPYFSSYWKNLIDIWEFGGDFIVSARKKGGYLQPAPGLLVEKINKHIAPRYMFTGGTKSKEGELVDYISKKVKSEMRKI